MRYELDSMLPEMAFRPRLGMLGGMTLEGGKGGGGGGQAPAEQRVEQTSIPSYARPYVEKMLGKTETLTDIDTNPYQPYGGQRIADFNQNQKDVFADVMNQKTSGQLGSGTDLATQSGYGALNMAGQAGGFQNQSLGFGQAGSDYGAVGAQQANQTAQQAGRQADMYGRQSAMTGMGGLGYGAQGAGYGAQGSLQGMQGANIGASLGQQSTNPNAVQSFMNPYLQASLDPQLKEIQRGYDIQGTQQQANATRSGAFGGSREALMNAENQRNAGTARNQAIGQGYNQAFNQAQQQMNAANQAALAGNAQAMQGSGMGIQGAQAGMQGINTALQGIQGAQQGVNQRIQAGQLGLQGTAQGIQGAQAGMQGVSGALNAGQYGLQGLSQAGQAATQLGQLGQTQFAQQQAINAGRQQVGALQQAQSQQGLDLGYQDFINQKNYPYQQLAFQSDMLRGLPVSQSAAQLYKAPPSTASQVGGLGMQALGIYGASGGFRGGASGGLPQDFKSYAQGGLTYATGGDIKTMSTEQLTKLLKNPNLTPTEIGMIEEALMVRKRMEMNPQSEQIMSQALSGIGNIPTGDMIPEQMAGGGIVAFSGGGSSTEALQNSVSGLQTRVNTGLDALQNNDPFKDSRAQDELIRAQIKEAEDNKFYNALARFGAKAAAGKSQYALSNFGDAGGEAVTSLEQTQATKNSLQNKLLEQGVEREKNKYSRDVQLLSALQTSLGQGQKGLAEIEDRKERKAAAAALAAQGKETANLTKAAALINSDPVIKSLNKQLQDSGYQPGSDEYNFYEQRVVERQNQIYKTVGVTVPEITPSTIPFPKPKEKPSLIDRMFGGSKSAAPGTAGNPIVLK